MTTLIPSPLATLVAASAAAVIGVSNSPTIEFIMQGGGLGGLVGSVMAATARRRYDRVDVPLVIACWGGLGAGCFALYALATAVV